MSRIRSVKPGFYRHEGLQELEAQNPGCHCMLVFSGLWCICDRGGRFQWKPRVIKLDILPFLDFDMAKTLDLLADAGFLIKYEVNGEMYGMVPTFEKHQTFDSRKNEKDIHPPPINPGFVLEGSGTNPGSIPDEAGTPPGRKGNMEGEEGKRKEERCPADEDAP